MTILDLPEPQPLLLVCPSCKKEAVCWCLPIPEGWELRCACGAVIRPDEQPTVIVTPCS